jgi:hypothetical protein
VVSSPCVFIIVLIIHTLSYFLLQFFPPFATNDFKGIQFHDQDIDSIRRRVVDYVSNLTGSDRPKSWPTLQPLR